MLVVRKRQFQVKCPSGDQFSGSWWSKVDNVVDIRALGLRDAVDKRIAMILTLAARKARSSFITKPIHSTNIFWAL